MCTNIARAKNSSTGILCRATPTYCRCAIVLERGRKTEKQPKNDFREREGKGGGCGEDIKKTAQSINTEIDVLLLRAIKKMK